MSQKNPAPLALEWLCFLRDHGHDLKVTLGERALASLLPTYGQGKNIYVSMVTRSKKTGWSRTTVRKHRDGLIAKGLLEDITWNPDKQERTYRLTMPGYVSHELGREATQQTPELGQNLTTPDQNLTTPDQNLTTPWPGSDHNIKLLDQGLDQAQHHQRDGDAARKGQGQNPGGQAPQTPQEPGASSSVPVSPADEEYSYWLGDSEYAVDNRAWLARLLGVSLGSIGAPLWRLLDDLEHRANSICNCKCPVHGENECPDTCEEEEDPCTVSYRKYENAVTDAAAASRGKGNPVGYFTAIVPTYVEPFLLRPA